MIIGYNWIGRPPSVNYAGRQKVNMGGGDQAQGIPLTGFQNSRKVSAPWEAQKRNQEEGRRFLFLVLVFLNLLNLEKPT